MTVQFPLKRFSLARLRNKWENDRPAAQLKYAPYQRLEAALRRKDLDVDPLTERMYWSIKRHGLVNYLVGKECDDGLVRISLGGTRLAILRTLNWDKRVPVRLLPPNASMEEAEAREVLKVHPYKEILE